MDRRNKNWSTSILFHLVSYHLHFDSWRLRSVSSFTKGKALHYNYKGKHNVESNTDDTVVRVCCDLLPMRVNRVNFFFCKRLTC